MLAIISEMLNFRPVGRGTDVARAVEYVSNAQKKRCTAFLISDFMTEADYSQALVVAGKKHDLVAVQVYDPREQTLPDVGMMRVVDAETGRERWIDTSSKRTRAAYADWWTQNQQRMREAFLRSRVDNISVATGDDFVPPLMELFKRRGG